MLKELLSKIPSWLYIFLLFIVAVLIAYYHGRHTQKLEDDIALANAAKDTVFVDTPIKLPPAPEPKPLKGKVKELPDSIINELRALKLAKIESEEKIRKYDSLLCERSKSWEVEYEDDVQHSTIISEPIGKITIPIIDYKEPRVKVPQIMQTIKPPTLPWYQEPETKVISGAVGGILLYSAVQSPNNSSKLWLGMGSVLAFTFGFAL